MEKILEKNPGAAGEVKPGKEAKEQQPQGVTQCFILTF